MPKYLLDTNACIAVRDSHRGKRPKDQDARDRVERLKVRLQSLPANEVAMSIVSMGELRFGADKSAAPQHNHELLDRLCEMIAVLPLAEPACRHYGEIRNALEAGGRTIGPNDMWIAAHGRAAGHTVVTNNTREFARVPNLAVEDWTQ